MKKTELQNLSTGNKVMDKRNNTILSIVGLDKEQGKAIMDNGKVYSFSTIYRWFNLVEEQPVEEKTVEEKAVEEKPEQPIKPVEEKPVDENHEDHEDHTEQANSNVLADENTCRKNLDFEYLGDIILVGHKYSMLSNYGTKTIWFCTVEAHTIMLGSYGYGSITSTSGSQMFNCTRGEAELDNEVRILEVKQDYINRFQGKNLKVKIRKAFHELNEDHSLDYLNKNCPIITLPKSFWTDIVLPLKEGNDILPELVFYSLLKGNEQGAPTYIGVAGNELHVLEVNPKILPDDLVNKLRAYGFKDSYMEQGYLINIHMKELGQDFESTFNEIANIVGLYPITDQQQNTQQQEQQEDTTANTANNHVVEGENSIEELFNQFNKILDEHNCFFEQKKQYIAVLTDRKKGTLLQVRPNRQGSINIDIKRGIWEKLKAAYKVELQRKYNAYVYDKTRGYIRLNNMEDVNTFTVLLLVALS